MFLVANLFFHCSLIDKISLLHYYYKKSQFSTDLFKQYSLFVQIFYMLLSFMLMLLFILSGISVINHFVLTL